MCQFSFLWILLEECLNLLLKQRGVVPGLVFLDFVKVYSTGNLVLAHKVDFLPWRRGWNPRPTRTMVAAEPCDSLLCRSVAGCWVSGLCQRSIPLTWSAPISQLRTEYHANRHAPMARMRRHYTLYRCMKSISRTLLRGEGDFDILPSNSPMVGGLKRMSRAPFPAKAD